MSCEWVFGGACAVLDTHLWTAFACGMNIYFVTSLKTCEIVRGSCKRMIVLEEMVYHRDPIPSLL